MIALILSLLLASPAYAVEWETEPCDWYSSAHISQMVTESARDTARDGVNVSNDLRAATIEEWHRITTESQTAPYAPIQAYYSPYSNEFVSQGVVEENGTRYTWYSQRVLPGGGLDELNSNGRHVDEDGLIRDADGFIAVASSDHEQGDVVATPWGDAKVYDTGCDSGVIDVYTDF